MGAGHFLTVIECAKCGELMLVRARLAKGKLAVRACNVSGLVGS